LAAKILQQFLQQLYLPEGEIMPRTTKPKSARFPLTFHKATGRYCKAFTLPNGRRRMVYFSSDADESMTKYLTEREDWQAGRNPREGAIVQRSTALILADIVNAFCTRSNARVATGELSSRTLVDYVDAGKAMAAFWGRNRDPATIGPQDFSAFRAAQAAKYAPSRLSKTITVCRMMFRWAFESELLDRMPRFGPDFKTAGKRAVRAAKAESGAKLLTAAEIQAVLSKASTTLRAMVLLGINCGLGNADVAALPLTALDLDAGWLNFPRPKTGIDRRCPLWPETVKALRTVLAERDPRPEAESLVFVTSRGRPWLTVKPDGKRRDGIVIHFRKACEAVKVHRSRMGFYWLRHTLQTIGDGAKDPLATAHLMGHADGTMGGHYRESIDDARLQAVADHVRAWLNAKPSKDKPKATEHDRPKLRLHVG
jgi:integrase